MRFPSSSSACPKCLQTNYRYTGRAPESTPSNLISPSVKKLVHGSKAAVRFSQEVLPRQVLSACPPRKPVHSPSGQDNTALVHLNDATILENLRARHEASASTMCCRARIRKEEPDDDFPERLMRSTPTQPACRTRRLSPHLLSPQCFA